MKSRFIFLLFIFLILGCGTSCADDEPAATDELAVINTFLDDYSRPFRDRPLYPFNFKSV